MNVELFLYGQVKSFGLFTYATLDGGWGTYSEGESLSISIWTRLLVTKELTFPFVLTNACGVVPEIMVDI